jgi:Flp pilus assembly protein TadG
MDARGQALAEAALALPILVTLVLGAIQLGLWYHAELVTRLACQDGARVAAAADGTLAGGIGRTEALLVAGLGRAGASAAVQGSEDDATATIRAQGSFPTLIPWVVASRLPLRCSASVYRERFRTGTSQ